MSKNIDTLMKFCNDIKDHQAFDLDKFGMHCNQALVDVTMLKHGLNPDFEHEKQTGNTIKPTDFGAVEEGATVDYDKIHSEQTNKNWIHVGNPNGRYVKADGAAAYTDPSISNKNDPVNHPAHYTSHPSGIECIEITRHMSFNIGNATKYLWRCGKKVSPNEEVPAKMIEELQKAIWYINDEIKLLKGEIR